MADISELVEDRIEAIASSLESASTKAQVALFEEVKALVYSLDIGKDGLIKNTSANLKQVNKIDRLLNSALKDEAYNTALREYLAGMGLIAEEWDGYFTKLFGSAYNPDRVLYDRLWDQAKTTTKETMQGLGVKSVVGPEIKTVIRTNINARATAKELEKTLRDLILGNEERYGKLRSYVGQVSRDAASQFSRAYTDAVSMTLGMDWFRYSRGKVRDSRQFCVDRQGKYFHRSEIEKWPKMNWQGKIPSTNEATIYVYLGGYNCMHILRPVSESSVPEADRQRVGK